MCHACLCLSLMVGGWSCRQHCAERRPPRGEPAHPDRLEGTTTTRQADRLSSPAPRPNDDDSCLWWLGCHAMLFHQVPMACVSGLAVASLQLLNEKYRPYKGTHEPWLTGGHAWLPLDPCMDRPLICYCCCCHDDDDQGCAPSRGRDASRSALADQGTRRARRSNERHAYTSSWPDGAMFGLNGTLGLPYPHCSASPLAESVLPTTAARTPAALIQHLLQKVHRSSVRQTVQTGQ